MHELVILLQFVFHALSIAEHGVNLTININIDVNLDNSDYQNKSVKLVDHRHSVFASGRKVASGRGNANSILDMCDLVYF